SEHPSWVLFFSLVIMRRFTNTCLRRFTNTNIFPGHPAQIYQYVKYACADLPIRLRRFTNTPAQIYQYACADLPIFKQLSTGVDQGIYLFPLVAYNYKL